MRKKTKALRSGYPVFASFEAVRCWVCGNRTRNHRDTEHADGDGRYQSDCEFCGLLTSFDLAKPGEPASGYGKRGTFPWPVYDSSSELMCSDCGGRHFNVRVGYQQPGFGRYSATCLQCGHESPCFDLRAELGTEVSPTRPARQVDASDTARADGDA